MLKKILLVSVLTLLVNCVTVGKVGYMAPADKDIEPIPTEVVGQYCGLVIVDIVDNLNTQLKSQNVTSMKDTTLAFKQGFMSANCLQAKK